MLAKTPEHRFPSAAELLRELHRLQVAHLGDAWAEDLPGAEAEDAALATAIQNESTRQLAAVMKTASQQAIGRPRWALWIAGAVAALLLGATAAWYTVREEPLLVRAGYSAPPIPSQGTAVRQWYYAWMVGTPEAWQSVIENFPNDTYWVNRAKQQLAMIYLRAEDYDRALDVFHELASLDEIETELRAFGLAGESGVLSIRGEYQRSEEIMARLFPIIDKLDPRMRQMVNFARRKNRAKLNLTAPLVGDEWLKQHFPDAG
jgi:tetratricopeptide (TPR) repeat protein